MRIAVTGASGFIGTEILAQLTEGEHEVIALTRGDTAAEGAPLSHPADPGLCTWKQTDYSAESLADALAGADAVIHLAGVRGTTSDPADYVINEIITENVLKGMRAAGAGRIVFASTISVYDDPDLIPWTEDAPLCGRTMYGESKIRCEELIREYAEEGARENIAQKNTAGAGFTYAIVRIAQVLGLGEKRRGMMNVFIDTAAAGGELKVIGRSEAKRQYIYVRDLARIMVMLAEGRPAGEDGSPEPVIVNAGMPRAYTNLEIAGIVNRVYANSTPINYDDSAPETIRPSCMDTGRLRGRLGYEPLDMEEALAEIRTETTIRI